MEQGVNIQVPVIHQQLKQLTLNATLPVIVKKHLQNRKR